MKDGGSALHRWLGQEEEEEEEGKEEEEKKERSEARSVGAPLPLPPPDSGYSSCDSEDQDTWFFRQKERNLAKWLRLRLSVSRYRWKLEAMRKIRALMIDKYSWLPGRVDVG